jgi:hypothetical protein
MPFALQTALTGNDEQTARLFAKTPLLVKAGAQAEVIVPSSLVGSVEFEWGNTVNRARTTDLTVGPCPAPTPDTWLVYPGGYYVPRPQCVQVIVRAGGIDTTISVGVGVACPGQQPPPQPTDT